MLNKKPKKRIIQESDRERTRINTKLSPSQGVITVRLNMNKKRKSLITIAFPVSIRNIMADRISFDLINEGGKMYLTLDIKGVSNLSYNYKRNDSKTQFPVSLSTVFESSLLNSRFVLEDYEKHECHDGSTTIKWVYELIILEQKDTHIFKFIMVSSKSIK